MASTTSIARVLTHLPPPNALRAPHRSTLLPLCRKKSTAATTSTSSSAAQTKPLVLEKPDRFRPPSHPARLPSRRTKAPYTYGPPVTAAEREAQARKRYPNMMPAEGTYLHWVLTNRMLHVYISLTVLFSLAVYTFVADFVASTPYRDLLPARAELLAHPLSASAQVASVYRMHAEHVSAETAERRKRKVDDIDKRAEFRRAHGLDADGHGLGGSGQLSGRSSVVEERANEEEERQISDVEVMRQRRPVKKWLGIW